MPGRYKSRRYSSHTLTKLRVDDPNARHDWEDLMWVMAQLRDERKRRRMSQEDVARQVGCSASYLGLLESGGRIPRVSAVQAYARAVGLRVILVLEEPEPNP